MATYDLNWTIDVFDNVVNAETIRLTFKDGLTDFIKHDADTTTGLFKTGGGLLFSITRSANIRIEIVYPTIQDVTVGIQEKEIGVYPLADVTPPFVIRHVGAFLSEMSQWEMNSHTY